MLLVHLSQSLRVYGNCPENVEITVPSSWNFLMRFSGSCQTIQTILSSALLLWKGDELLKGITA
jgi:hypothetical protein